jgi:endonuclease-3
MSKRWRLADAVEILEKSSHGRMRRPVTDPFQMILWDSVAYLVDDERRESVYQELRRRVGLTPEAILRAPDSVLTEAIREGGMRPPDRAARLKECAELAIEIGPARLRRLARTDPSAARKLLKQFPGVADPGADKILLHNRSLVTLGPDSSVLRVLVRLGFGREEKDYSKTYRSAAEAVGPELPADFDWLIRARQVLRRHGQLICVRNGPRCEMCPLKARCQAYQSKSFAPI